MGGGGDGKAGGGKDHEPPPSIWRKFTPMLTAPYKLSNLHYITLNCIQGRILVFGAPRPDTIMGLLPHGL